MDFEDNEKKDNSRKLLMLVHRVPYPPDKGDKIRSFNELKHLHKVGWSIYLVALADKPEDLRHKEALQSYCEEVHLIPMSSLQQKIKSLLKPFQGLPLSAGYFYRKSAQKVVDDLVQRIQMDALLCFCSPMAEYVYKTKTDIISSSLVKVMDLVDVDSDKWRQYSQKCRWPMNWVYRLESALLKRYEENVVTFFETTFLVSAAEAETLRTQVGYPEKVASVANGVDLDYFGPGKLERNNCRIVFCGAMDYYPNIDAVKWFVQEVFGGIKSEFPEAEFIIVGGGAGEDVKALEQTPGVRVTGRVEDVRPYVQGAALSVAPIRVARGIQNKVLEAMAMEVCVLSTPEAFEGIEADQDKDLVVASSETSEYLIAAVKLLRDPDLRRKIEKQGRKLVEQKYGWPGRLSALDDILIGKTTE